MRPMSPAEVAAIPDEQLIFAYCEFFSIAYPIYLNDTDVVHHIREALLTGKPFEPVIEPGIDY
ncbi:hypothetical protein FD04_GL001347 [Secundilactobacillus odoratitofui DSM 19909 = JCM 15043]|uniref:Uncharacterized protein n=1 Tax=Secundilactobacillus odoratitofui DSM 19909 = JCM 15043 TaxID=1423776 RepID=A0A0R1LUS3_9LACO|nr:hypothetical protein [Secundilactobacillus odoratitofui]KRK97331.1 hypothetical protein FD04_GL001347 [Secundilactobacillus odoratitofui DSM 19909 = JCM 15043]